MTTLDELRRANLQEQRRKAEAASSQAPAAPETPAAAPTKAALKQALPVPPEAKPAEVTTEAVAKVEPAAESAAPQAHLNGNGHAPAVDTTPEAPAAVDVVEDDVEAPAVDDAERKARAIMDRFYRGLAHKVVHPTGVKTTVDMPPDLFWRVKRYCHDHNNVTVRQLFLDLVIAVLEEEGY